MPVSKVAKTALFSRFLVIVLQYLGNAAIPDHNPAVFRTPITAKSSVLDRLVDHFLGGFLRWDAQYFAHIAQYGYTYENSLAFFPLYPALVGLVAQGGTLLTSLNIQTSILLASIVLNVIFFVLSAITLYNLTVHILGRDLAYKSAVLFCFNPSSVFFSAPYTECMFSYLSFKSMLICVELYKKQINNPASGLQFRKFISPIVFIGLSTLTRSNGILNVGFLIYILICLQAIQFRKTKDYRKLLAISARYISVAVFLSGLCLAPFIAFQVYCYLRFCTDFTVSLPEVVLGHAKHNNFVLPGGFSKYNQSWCHKTIPLAYSYVQDHYWNVGFMKYYEINQIPNFLIAAPLIFIILSNSWSFFKKLKLESLFHLNLTPQSRRTDFNAAAAVFIIHVTVLTIFCMANVHIQVTNRMVCSASPVLYWFAGKYFKRPINELVIGQFSNLEQLILSYFVIYYIAGVFLFCNYFPWT